MFVLSIILSPELYNILTLDIKYVNAPVAVCPCCNKYGILVDGRKKVDLGNPCPDYLYSYHCFYCGMKFEESVG